MDLGLNNATVIVAGGTTGMGRAAADCFAADGARVAVLARSRDQLDETAAALTALGRPTRSACRSTSSTATRSRRPSREVGERWGSLNALVNAAGPLAGDLKSFETYTDEDWLGVFDGLTLSSVRTIRAALPLLRAADWARIVNVSAMSTKHQSPPLVAYTAAKSALTSLTKNLAQSLAPDGILVNTVSPGTFASESFKAALAPIPDLDENDLHDIMRFINDNFGHQRLPQPGGRPVRDRTGHRFRRVRPQHLHDRWQPQRRRRFGLHVTITLTHLQRLEAESIQIIREAVAGVREAGDAVLGRQGQRGACCTWREGVLPVGAAVPAAARRHDVEVPGDVRVPRPDGEAGRHGPARAPEPGVRWRAASTRSTTARRCTPTCGRPRG